MRHLSFCLAAALAVGWLSAGAQVGFADDDDHDHHRHRGVAKHRSGFQLFNPLGVRVTITDQHDQRNHYRYVVPSGGRHGAFYTHEDVHYYSPPVTRVIVQQPGQPAPPTPRPAALKFGGFQHHEQLAERLEGLANQFCLELHHNYQHNPGYDEVYREAYKLLQAAKFVHTKDHQGDHAAIQRSINGIDELFHHVQEDIRGWQSANQRRVGHLNLAAKTEELEAVLHHLMFDIGVKPAHDDEAAPQPRGNAPVPREEAPPPQANEPRSIRIPIPQP